MTSRITAGRFPGAGALSATGKLFALGLDIFVGIFQRPFQTKEFIEQCWFISRVCILPAALVSISFGSVISPSSWRPRPPTGATRSPPRGP